MPFQNNAAKSTHGIPHAPEQQAQPEDKVQSICFFPAISTKRARGNRKKARKDESKITSKGWKSIREKRDGDEKRNDGRKAANGAYLRLLYRK